MSDAIIVALITGGLSLVGVVIAGRKNAREMEHKLEVRQAVTDTKIEELTREVRLHNGFAEKIPAMQAEIKTLVKNVDKLQGFHME